MKEIFEIDSFEQQCLIIKGLLHYEQMKKHMVAIGIDKSLSNSALYERRFLKNPISYTKPQVNMRI